MTEVVLTFSVAFFFSFIGTIPPGTLNLTILQLGLNEKINVAWRMAVAAAVIEYPYAWIAIEFQDYLTRSLEFTHNFHLVSAIVMVTLGMFNLWSSARSFRFYDRFDASGFKRGILLALLNPLAIPFWTAMTAYLKSYGWVDLSDETEIHAYLLGVSTGSLVLFMLLAYLASKVIAHLKSNSLIKKTPGVVLVLLGIYAFGEYIFG